MFEADEIRLMIDSATDRTRAWILLGINCAFIQRDISDPIRSAVDLKSGFIDFPRRKTSVERRVPLWKQTINALKAVDAPTKSVDRYFHTTTGQVLVLDHPNDSRSDAVHDALERLQKKLESRGRSVGSVHCDTRLERSLMKHAIFLRYRR